MKNNPATIKDIARKLNLSVTTISKALRGMPDISVPTRQLIVETARQMDYQPNPIAQSLVKNQTHNIGVIIPSFTIPFYASAISGIQQTAAEAGYNIMVCQSNESVATEITYTQLLLNNRVDGLIVSLSRETTSFDHFAPLIRRSIPLVFFNRVSEEMPVSKVVVDDYQGAYRAVSYLIERGCRRIAHIAGPENLLLSQQRLKGYVDAMREAGLSVPDEYIRHGDLTIANGAFITSELLTDVNPPDAVFAVCDSAAFGALQAAKSRELNIPSDLALVGFTDEPVAAIVEPALTTVAQPIFDIGQVAAKLFLDQIRLGESYTPTTHVLETRLVVRQSTP
ncbi:LacI family transcriptional regulator [Fibrisoma montanum]|uniref:LacI family transcriptional regulator n=1 Tax=Fibrisoma montanum TaxID=2305895 RepID=A0A418LXM1_9BACT|nr:LacI family DNA-binding transcriptional regulator [Fibrisoma montanum]RIV17975.1 LacI family transcriptional regulator [Fibrisoma montanum]